MTSHSSDGIVEGRVVKPRVGSVVELKGTNLVVTLQPCDDWDEADFRVDLPQTKTSVACNVHVTGTVLVRKGGELAVRCQVEFVRDGEPNEFCLAFIHYHTAVQDLCIYRF